NIAPRASTQDTRAPRDVRGRLAVRGSVFVTLLIAVGHPFPHVAMHVMETKCISVKGTDGSYLLVIPLTTATVTVSSVPANIFTPGVLVPATCPSRVLPFCLV